MGGSSLSDCIGVCRRLAPFLITVGLEIQWPGDAQPQRFAAVPKNKAIEIRQFASDYRVIERPRFKLGGDHGR